MCLSVVSDEGELLVATRWLFDAPGLPGGVELYEVNETLVEE